MSLRCCLFGCLQIVENHLRSKIAFVCALCCESQFFSFSFSSFFEWACACARKYKWWTNEIEKRKCRIMAMSLEWHSWKDQKRADVKCTCNDTLQAVWMCRYWGHNHLLNDRVVMAWISNETETHWIRNFKKGSSDEKTRWKKLCERHEASHTSTNIHVYSRSTDYQL